MSGQRRNKRPYDAFVADVYTTLLAEVTTYAASIPGGLPAGFEVADFVQHALLKLTETYDRRRSEAAAYTYARKTAINALLDAVRAAARRELPEWLAGVAATHGGAGRTPDETADHLSRRQRVEDALDRLPDRQRQAARLLYMEGFSRAEAAKIMGLSTAAVKSLAQRARVTLAAALKHIPGVAAVAMAAQSATRRLRRPAALAAAAAPRFAVVLCLTVAQQPIALRMPRAEAYVIPASRNPRNPGVAGDPLVVPQLAHPPQVATVTAPSWAGGARVPRRPSVPRPQTPPKPKVGGCVGEACIGDAKVGDELCLEHEQQDQPPVCANQDLLGVCPTAEQLALPRTRCTRHSDPTFDP